MIWNQCFNCYEKQVDDLAVKYLPTCGSMLKLQYSGVFFTGKDPDAGKDWRQEEKGMTEDEMVGWHHRRHGQEFEQAPGVGAGQGDLVCCSPCGRKELDMTEWLNWTDVNPWKKSLGNGKTLHKYKVLWLQLLMSLALLLEAISRIHSNDLHFLSQ